MKRSIKHFVFTEIVFVVHVKDFVMKEGKPEFAHVGEGLFHYEL